MDDLTLRLLDAIPSHVVFDGWSDAAFAAACADCGIDPGLARLHLPRGALDLAVAFHKAGDRTMVQALAGEDLGALRFRDRVTRAVWLRLQAVPDREVVRRGTTLFALPQHAAEGAALIWGTADAIWTALGDTSEDLNWYSKRAILSGVYAATVLYWLGDDSQDHSATRDFLDRRIEGVMRFEKVKAGVRGNPLLRPFAAGLDRFAAHIRKPARRDDLPGSMTP
jgi:ubiquinone biosynthesis protein COQ9